MVQPPILVLGSVNVDLVVRAPHLPRAGETVTGGRYFHSLGGKGANQAVAAARLFRPPTTGWGYASPSVGLIAAIGEDDFGDQAKTALASENVALDHLKTMAGAATGIALIVVDEQGENQIAVASGANSELLEADIDALAEDVYQGASILLTSLEIPLPTASAALRRALAAGAKTVLNPAPASASVVGSGLLDLVDVLTPNAQEAGVLTGMTVDDPGSAADAGHKLLTLGCGAVVVTLGARGALVVEEQGATHVPAPHVQAVDTTAAGDALNGALAVALCEGKPLVEAVRFACGAAALSVTRLGALPSLPTREEITAFAPHSKS